MKGDRLGAARPLGSSRTKISANRRTTESDNLVVRRIEGPSVFDRWRTESAGPSGARSQWSPIWPCSQRVSDLAANKSEETTPSSIQPSGPLQAPGLTALISSFSNSGFISVISPGSPKGSFETGATSPEAASISVWHTRLGPGDLPEVSGQTSRRRPRNAVTTQIKTGSATDVRKLLSVSGLHGQVDILARASRSITRLARALLRSSILSKLSLSNRS